MNVTFKADYINRPDIVNRALAAFINAVKRYQLNPKTRVDLTDGYRISINLIPNEKLKPFDESFLKLESEMSEEEYHIRQNQLEKPVIIN